MKVAHAMTALFRSAGSGVYSSVRGRLPWRTFLIAFVVTLVIFAVLWGYLVIVNPEPRITIF
jgi:hypothetical protein